VGEPPRVLLVGRGHPERGGIAASIDAILASPIADGDRVSFLNLTPAERGGGGRLDHRNAGRTARDALAVWRQAGDHDVVHIHSALAPGPTLLRAGILAAAARTRGARVIVHGHGGRIPGWLRSGPRRLLARAALAAAHVVIAVSTGGADALRAALGDDRVRLVDNGVEAGPPPVRREHAGPPRILYVGILTERKGVLDLLRASDLLLERGHEHELWLVGGTPDEGAAAAAAVRDAAGAAARLLGEVEHDEVLALLREVDVFCLPSWWEAMPLSILEAMAAGLPVVATDVGDVQREVEDGRTGTLVAPRDPTSLADALGDLLVDPDRRQRLGAAGRSRVLEHFTVEGMVTRLDDLYRSPRR
jgi:glycosyltransferase involved in cell wall biosynthesis